MTQNEEHAAAMIMAQTFMDYADSLQRRRYDEDEESQRLADALRELMPEARKGSNLERLFLAFAAGVSAGMDLVMKVEDMAKAARWAEQQNAGQEPRTVCATD